MTEPDVASSDATNMAATAILDGDEVVLNGRKWWSTGIGHPDCELLIFMGLHRPRRATGTRATRWCWSRATPPASRSSGCCPRWAPYDEPHGHGEVSFTDVRVPASNILVGSGPRLRDRAGPARVRAGSTTACG